MASRLLASSPTIEGIERMVNRFWVSEHYRVNPTTLELTHAQGRDVPLRAAVEYHKGRYHFVMRAN